MKKSVLSMNIILVDDDKDDQAIFKQAFDDLYSGNDLLLFGDGYAALAHLNITDIIPDIIFLDLNMPRLNGWELLEQIRKSQRYKFVTVAIYSTSSLESDIEKALTHGANVFITKPSSYPKLREIIGKVLVTNAQYMTSGLNKSTFIMSI